jgi:hypothetical protein
MSNKSSQALGCVEMMRSIRNGISAEIRGLTAEEEIAWLRSAPLSDPLLRRLQQKAAQQRDTAETVAAHRV